MKPLRQFGALLLLLVSSVAPAMACMAPDAPMATEERSCCRMMQGQCGQMDMPGPQDCCKKVPKTVYDSALKTDTASPHPAVFVTLWVSSFEMLIPQSASSERVQRPQHSPPKPPPSAITILRI